ncbi:hypothetical protein GH714_007036 [Hevea brasiliensis]|uniref:Uncharacterized protein n=1 Tax=Hevea brasiliensis TaxID=3981 RepID=A0A6A6L2Z7_HEVBR|nr:hypothetical protein GH714_007036 [Hevea brasiliensis]
MNERPRPAKQSNIDQNSDYKNQSEQMRGSTGAMTTSVMFYLLGQDLWEIVGGVKTSAPTNSEYLKKRKARVGKAMYALSISVEDELLQRIKDAKTPKEAWDTFAELFT